MVKTNAEWIEWGKRDPFFGVAAGSGKEIGGSNPWTPRDFYALGETDWQVFEEQWRRYGFQSGSFVEIGCGAGRITKQLAKAFETGHALDVSNDMIALASANVPGKVSWHVTGGAEIPLPDESVDAAFSCHVFQHLPSLDVAQLYFQEIYRALKPGGSMMIHLPIYSLPEHASAKVARVLSTFYKFIGLPLQNAKIALQRTLMRFGGKPPMNGLDYEVNELGSFLDATGFNRVEIVFFSNVNSPFLFPFVFATKPPAD